MSSPAPAAPVPKIETIFDRMVVVEPPCKVIIHNDDVTPMDFVVDVLTSVFELDVDTAFNVMLTAHNEGNAYVATYPREQAEARVNKAHFAARLEGYPLRLTIEPDRAA